MVDKRQYRNSQEEKRITNYFMIAKDKYRLCFTPRGDTKKVSILLNYKITCFGPALKQIIGLKKYDLIKIYTKSEFISDSKEVNFKLISDLVVNDYIFTIFDLDLIRNSQESSYSLFIVFERKKDCL